MQRLTLKEIEKRLNKLTPNLIEAESQAIIQSDHETIKAKVFEFKRGFNPDGSNIGTYRNPVYSNYKQAKNPLNRGFVDLINTGSYVNKLYVKKVSRFENSFYSRDSKDEMLAGKYGNQIRGLSPFQQRELNKRHRGLLARRLKQIARL